MKIQDFFMGVSVVLTIITVISLIVCIKYIHKYEKSKEENLYKKTLTISIIALTCEVLSAIVSNVIWIINY